VGTSGVEVVEFHDPTARAQVLLRAVRAEFGHPQGQDAFVESV
jgi:hypothetical protein